MAEGSTAGDQRGPARPPVVYGPSTMGTAVRAGMQPADDRVGGVENSGLDTARDSRSGVDEPLGLSVRERNILSSMKEAMIRISQQNEQLLSQNDALWSRVLRLGEERSTSQAWQSAEICRGSLGSC